MASYGQWINALPSPKGMLKDIQKSGRESLLKNGLPTRKMEAWRLTNLKRLEKFLTLQPSVEGEKEANLRSQVWAKAPENAFRLVLKPNEILQNLIDLPSGLRPLTNKEIKACLDDSFKYIPHEEQWPLSVNCAANNEVFGLHVSGNTCPQLELIIPAEENVLIPSRVIIKIEEDAQLDLLQVVLGATHSAHSHILEIYMAKNSTLNHGFVAIGGGKASCLAQVSVVQESFSSYSLNSVQHGWSISRFEPKIIQKNGHSKTTLNGLQIAKGDEQLATHSSVRFEGPEGSLNQLQKATANGESHSIFNGIIEVPQIAQKTNASQLSRNLLLSSKARVDTKPELKIIADDVKCAHGATISQPQEEELFYLRSRGINAKQASKLLLKGYCQEIIDNLPVQANRWKILNTLLGNIS